jgi:tetratricopeptide (TPR) repeat protein
MAPVQSMIEESFSIYEELGDQQGLAHCFFLQASDSEETKTRLGRYQRALQLFRETNDKPMMARTLLHMGWWMESLESGRRISYLEESLSLYRELGYISGTIEALKQLGSIEVHLGHFDSAHQRLDEGFSILQAHATSLGNSRILSYDLGDLAYYEGDYKLAQKYYEHCLAWATQKGLSISISYAKIRLGFLFSRRGDEQKAYFYLRDALLSFQRAGDQLALIFTLEGFAMLAGMQRRFDQAAQLFAWADGKRKKNGDHRLPVEQVAVDRDLEVIRSHLDEADLTRLWGEGQAMTVEEAIALALQE